MAKKVIFLRNSFCKDHEDFIVQAMKDFPEKSIQLKESPFSPQVRRKEEIRGLMDMTKFLYTPPSSSIPDMSLRRHILDKPGGKKVTRTGNYNLKQIPIERSDSSASSASSASTASSPSSSTESGYSDTLPNSTNVTPGPIRKIIKEKAPTTPVPVRKSERLAALAERKKIQAQAESIPVTSKITPRMTTPQTFGEGFDQRNEAFIKKKEERARMAQRPIETPKFKANPVPAFMSKINPKKASALNRQDTFLVKKAK